MKTVCCHVEYFSQQSMTWNSFKFTGQQNQSLKLHIHDVMDEGIVIVDETNG